MNRVDLSRLPPELLPAAMAAAEVGDACAGVTARLDFRHNGGTCVAVVGTSFALAEFWASLNSATQDQLGRPRIKDQRHRMTWYWPRLDTGDLA